MNNSLLQGPMTSKGVLTVSVKDENPLDSLRKEVKAEKLQVEEVIFLSSYGPTPLDNQQNPRKAKSSEEIRASEPPPFEEIR